MSLHSPEPRGWIAALRAFLREPAVQVCDLCGAPLAPDHPHLVDLGEHGRAEMRCCCRACAVLFGNQQGGRFRRVPEEGEYLADFRLTDEQWDALAIPIGIAFFYRDSSEGRIVAMYPGPAGAMRSALGLTAWERLVADNPVLGALQPDVEALLVNRVEGAREYYRVPIDQCYALTGVIRSHWHGVSGGPDARRALGSCLAELKAGVRMSGGAGHART
jgi:hypothetical protein